MKTRVSLALIGIGASLLFVFSVIPHLVDIRTLGFLFAAPNAVLYGGYAALGGVVIGQLSKRRKI